MNQKGNGLIIGVIIGALVILGLFGAYYLGIKQIQDQLPSTISPVISQVTPSTIIDQTSNWQTYTNATLKYTLKIAPGIVNIVNSNDTQGSAVFVKQEESTPRDNYTVKLDILFRSDTTPEDGLKGETPNGPACIDAPPGSSCNPKTQPVKINNASGIQVISGATLLEYYVKNSNQKGSVVRITLSGDPNDPQIINLKQMIQTFQFIK